MSQSGREQALKLADSFFIWRSLRDVEECGVERAREKLVQVEVVVMCGGLVLVVCVSVINRTL